MQNVYDKKISQYFAAELVIKHLFGGIDRTQVGVIYSRADPGICKQMNLAAPNHVNNVMTN